tara:strand:- start:6982 stop:7413 length:432 start_codon:yes stop_codon:yes gene_type:complete
MRTRTKEETVIQYFKVLKDLHFLLSNTKRISMNDFCGKNNVSKRIPIVLQKGGVIRMLKKGRSAEWEWISIEPTREMAIKLLNTLASKPDGRKNNGGHTTNGGRKPNAIENRYLDSYTIKLLGVFKMTIKLNYKEFKPTPKNK